MRTIKWIFIIICIFTFEETYSQNNFTAILKDKATNEPLIGATAVLEGTTTGSSADFDGNLTITGIPDGKHVIVFSYVGHETLKDTFEFPLTMPQPYIALLQSGQELKTVQISATRSSRSIEDIPTRMEAITAEELGEKAAMNSTNISMLLRESTGIMVQQTSANSGNQTLRIQGLDGRYTQLLKDGFPLYSGFSSGLSVMQVPPLDLRQVEVIKGSASTLYGGGAIAGLVNLVSKQPVENEPELSIMLNQTSALGTTANTFWSQRFKKTGFTFFASANNQIPYDPNNDGFSDIPKVQSISVNPKFFWYPSDSTKLWFGLNTSFEDRLGGDLQIIEDKADSLHTFSERNLSKRISSQLHFEHRFQQGGLLTLRNSVSYFDRNITIPDYVFQGQQIASFSEATWTKESDKTDWIIGGNLFTSDFTEDVNQSATQPRSYSYLTTGIFAQNNWNINEKFILESGFRTDYNTNYGLFPLPRVSLLIKPTNTLTFRMGGGMGYKLPTIFNEESEAFSFHGVAPLDMNTIKPENSIGANFDVNYKTIIGDKLTFSINQLFFYTQLTNSLVLEPDSTGTIFSFANADGPVDSKGFETNIKFTLKDFKLFLQYAYTDVLLKYNNINKQKPLTPKHNFGATLMYEQEHKWRIGYEIYYIGQQFRSDYSQTRDYWMMGFMALREFKLMSIFINFENFTDTRQSRYQSMITPPNSDPTFTEIWAPTDGFVANAGLIIKLFLEHDD
jgi:outer membrane receptor for ferrienterochelin and colicins